MRFVRNKFCFSVLNLIMLFLSHRSRSPQDTWKGWSNLHLKSLRHFLHDSRNPTFNSKFVSHSVRRRRMDKKKRSFLRGEVKVMLPRELVQFFCLSAHARSGATLRIKLNLSQILYELDIHTGTAKVGIQYHNWYVCITLLYARFVCFFTVYLHLHITLCSCLELYFVENLNELSPFSYALL